MQPLTEPESARAVAARARAAATSAASLDNAVRNRVVRAIAESLLAQTSAILGANLEDLSAARGSGLGAAKLQRLELDASKVRAMAAGLMTVAALPDPVGKITHDVTRSDGLRVQKVRIPLGAILMIYEARPNVTIDAFALCFKAGNACVLKGGREAVRTNRRLHQIVVGELERANVDPAVVQLVDASDRGFLQELLQQDECLDLVIPRGGESLIRFVHEHSRIPTVLHFHGVCHVVVDRSADLTKALAIVRNGKISAPATCNATEAVLVHRDVAAEFVPLLVRTITADGVQVRGDARVCALAPDAIAATDADWGREFLDLVLAVRVVDDLQEALAHVERHGSRHSDAIVTEDPAAQAIFLAQVGSSCALVNASTRFNDGGQLGLGAEIGISTTRVHAFGPMGLEELTTQRWVVRGDGHVR